MHNEVRKLDPKWLLARVAREFYPPETLKAELSGPDGKPIQTQTEVRVNITCTGAMPEFPIEEYRPGPN